MAAEPTVARALQANGSTSVGVSVAGGGLPHALLEEFDFVGRQSRLHMELGEAPRTKGFTNLRHHSVSGYLAVSYRLLGVSFR